MLFAVSVTVNSTLTPSRFKLPGTTMPPMRKVRPCGASFAATCEGVKKNTRFLLNAESTSAAAMPSAARPPTMARVRVCLGCTLVLLCWLENEHYFQPKKSKGHAVRAPNVQRVAAHGEEV